MTGPTGFVQRWRGHPYSREEHHCWWLTRLCQREVFGRDVPECPPGALADRRSRLAALHGHPEFQNWVVQPGPVHGAVALMERGILFHAGVYLDAFGILHTNEPHGIVFDSPLELAAVQRWRIAYYLPAHP
jgi:hypothetical protein